MTNELTQNASNKTPETGTGDSGAIEGEPLSYAHMADKTCGTCRWFYDAKAAKDPVHPSVCTNDASEWTADFRSTDDTCESWQGVNDAAT